MAEAILGFSDLSIPEKIQKAKIISGKLNGNTNFANPEPPLTDVDDAIEALETAAEDAKDGGKAKTSIMYVKEQAPNNIMRQVVAYVQSTSKGDETLIKSTGLSVKVAKTAPQPLEAPQRVTAAIGKKEGEVLIKWKRIDAAKAYLVQQSADGNTGWADCGTSTKASITIAGLTSGGKFWFRICAIGSKGEGPFSAPAKGMAA
jgi:hypothetical protein